MKKLIMLMLLMSVLKASAQLYVTPEIGMTAFNLSQTNQKNFYAGWKAGAAVEYQFKNRAFALQSGVYYTQKQFPVEVYPYLDTANEWLFCAWGTTNNHYLQIPLLFKFGWKLTNDIRMHLAFGPIVEISLSNTGKGVSRFIDYGEWEDAGAHLITYLGRDSDFYWYPNESGEYIEYKVESSHFKFDKDPTRWGAMFNIGLDIKDWVVKGSYDFTASENNYNGGMKTNQHTVSLTVGYKFKLTR